MKKTLRQLKSEVEKHGGVLAEDAPYRHIRNIQLEAPEGKMWKEGMVTAIRVAWVRGSSNYDVRHNNEEFDFAVERMECGTVETVNNG